MVFHTKFEWNWANYRFSQRDGDNYLERALITFSYTSFSPVLHFARKISWLLWRPLPLTKGSLTKDKNETKNVSSVVCVVAILRGNLSRKCHTASAEDLRMSFDFGFPRALHIATRHQQRWLSDQQSTKLIFQGKWPSMAAKQIVKKAPLEYEICFSPLNLTTIHLRPRKEWASKPTVNRLLLFLLCYQTVKWSISEWKMAT